MSFKYDVKLLRESAKGDAVLGIMTGTPDDHSMPTSDVYYGLLDNGDDSYFCFWINSVIMDVSFSSNNDFSCVDNEGHLFTTLEVKSSPLDLVSEVAFGHNETLIPKINSYRFSEYPINALWSNDDILIFADEKGVVWHLENGEYKSYDTCCEPLSFFGDALDNLYLYGRKGQLWHFNGVQWSNLSLPDMGLDYWSISGGEFLESGEVVFVTSYGFVFIGDAINGFHVINSPKKKYSGITKYKNRYFVTCKEEGLFELVNIEGLWELYLVTPARRPLTLNCMGKGDGEALFMACAEDIGKPYFVVAEPGSASGEKKRAYGWEINVN